MVDRLPLDGQRSQRSVLELTEAPLVGVGNEGDQLRTDDLVHRLGTRNPRIDLFMGHKMAGSAQLLIQARIHQPVIVFRVDRIDLPVYRPLLNEEEAAGVTK